MDPASGAAWKTTVREFLMVGRQHTGVFAWLGTLLG